MYIHKCIVLSKHTAIVKNIFIFSKYFHSSIERNFSFNYACMCFQQAMEKLQALLQKEMEKKKAIKKTTLNQIMVSFLELI